MSTTTKPKSDKQVQRTKKYRSLIEVGLSPDEAMKSYRRIVEADEPSSPDPDPLETLLAAGFSEEEAGRILAAGDLAPKEEEESEVLTSQQEGEALVARHGYDFAKGRVYVTPDTIEAAVRTRKTGSPEIVASSGVGRTSAVLVFRTEQGDVALQNLVRE